MKSKLISRILVTLCLSAVVTLTWHARAVTRTEVPNVEPAISVLNWMSGGWRTAPGGGPQIEEYWMRPASGSMIGMSRTIVGDKTVGFEYLRVEQRGDAIYYVSNPEARCPATDFKLSRFNGQEAIFENPEHDFPKRIIYRKNSDGSLTASIDGGEGTKAQSFAYLPLTK